MLRINSISRMLGLFFACFYLFFVGELLGAFGDQSRGVFRALILGALITSIGVLVYLILIILVIRKPEKSYLFRPLHYRGLETCRSGFGECG